MVVIMVFVFQNLYHVFRNVINQTVLLVYPTAAIAGEITGQPLVAGLAIKLAAALYAHKSSLLIFLDSVDNR